MDMHTGTEGHSCVCGTCKSDMKSNWKLMKAVRALTAVVVIVFVFWCGFQFGEIRAAFGDGMRGGYGMMQNRGYGMMGYGSPASGSRSEAIPSAPVNGDTVQGQAAGPAQDQ